MGGHLTGELDVAHIRQGDAGVALAEIVVAGLHIHGQHHGAVIIAADDLLGGQTAINLAQPLHDRGVKIIGTDCAAIDKAEDRNAFENLLKGIYDLAPIYYVNGNHEWGGLCTDEVAELLEKFGFYDKIYTVKN